MQWTGAAGILFVGRQTLGAAPATDRHYIMRWAMRPFDELMRDSLARASFDFDRPHPLVAWEAFKSFVVQPVPGQKTVTIGFTCYHASDRDQTLWLEFARGRKRGQEPKRMAGSRRGGCGGGGRRFRGRPRRGSITACPAAAAPAPGVWRTTS